MCVTPVLCCSLNGRVGGEDSGSVVRSQHHRSGPQVSWSSTLPLCLCFALPSSTYLCPSLLVKHRPSTTHRQCTLFWAALVIPVQLVPCCLSSASVFCLQLLRGRPLFLFPCRFQVRAWHVVLDTGFLRVCPIQPHFPLQYLLDHWFLPCSLPSSRLIQCQIMNGVFS